MDSAWFIEVCDLIGVECDNDAVQWACEHLYETNEVLPWLFLKTKSFSKWPCAKEALLKIIKNFTKLQRESFNRITVSSIDSKPLREALYNDLLALVLFYNPQKLASQNAGSDHMNEQIRKNITLCDRPSLFINP